MLPLQSLHIVLVDFEAGDLKEQIEIYGGTIDANIMADTNIIVFKTAASLKKNKTLAKAKGITAMTKDDFHKKYIIGDCLKDEKYFTITDNGPNVCQVVTITLQGVFLEKYEINGGGFEGANICIEVPADIKRKLRVGAVFLTEHPTAFNNNYIYGLWNGTTVLPLRYNEIGSSFIPREPAFDIISLNVPLSFWAKGDAFSTNENLVWFDPTKVTRSVIQGEKYIKFKTGGRSYQLPYDGVLDKRQLQLLDIGSYAYEDTGKPASPRSSSRPVSPVSPGIVISDESFFTIEDEGKSTCQIVYIDLQKDTVLSEKFMKAGEYGFRTANIFVKVPEAIQKKLRKGAVFVTDIETIDDNSIYGIWNGETIVRIKYDATEASIPEDPVFDVISMNVPVTFWYDVNAFDKFPEVIWVDVSKCKRVKKGGMDYITFKSGGKSYSFLADTNDARKLQPFSIEAYTDEHDSPRRKTPPAKKSKSPAKRSASPKSSKMSLDEVYAHVSKLSVTEKKELLKRILASC